MTNGSEFEISERNSNGIGRRRLSYDTRHGKLYVKELCKASETCPKYIKAEFRPKGWIPRLKKLFGYNTTETVEINEQDIYWDIYTEDTSRTERILMELESYTLIPHKPYTRFHNAVQAAIRKEKGKK